MTQEEFVKTSVSKLDPILQSHWEIDHLCFRTDSEEHYQSTKCHFESLGHLLIESPVGGRLIATYELDEALWYKDWAINNIEVPAPKANRKADRGYEHLEIVIDCSFEELQARYPNFAWDQRALSKSINPELEAHFENFNVKFHHHALTHIINLEKNDAIVRFLQASDILNNFSEFKPLLSGTIPLGIDIDGSDLDILFEVHDHENFITKSKQHFPGCEIRSDDITTVINFYHNNLPIEFYATNIDPLKQNAHRHLRIEGRLLKLLPLKFRQEIIQLKEDGFKTEPAFGKLLDLDRPYEDLLELYYLSDLELLKRFGPIYAMKPHGEP